MKHSQDDLLGEVMRMLRLRAAQAKSKQNLSRLAGSGGSVLRIGITRLEDPRGHPHGTCRRWHRRRHEIRVEDQ